MIISFDSNIGGGKSTQLGILSSKNDDNQYHIWQEELNEWISEGWLEHFYQDMNKFSLGFQMRVFYSQVKRYQVEYKPLCYQRSGSHNEWLSHQRSGSNQELLSHQRSGSNQELLSHQRSGSNQELLPHISLNSTQPIVLCERSPFTCHKIFGEMLVRDHLMSSLELDLCNKYNSVVGWMPDYGIYIRTSPDICYDRIQSRQRNSEKKIGFEYIRDLHEEHERKLLEQEIFPVFSINGDRNIEEIHQDVLDGLETIKSIQAKKIIF
jgi:deoxyadenosine/deoxycytidine kinase